MDGIPEINRNQPRQDDAVVNVTPPPTEVKIRTMRSDVASMHESGGGLPKFQNVKVSGLALEKAPAENPTAAHKSSALTAVIITIIALAVLGILIYFGYRILKGGAV